MVRDRLRGQRLAAPELIDPEVLSVLRRLVTTNTISTARSARAVADLADVRIQRVSHRPLIGRCWELRNNLTPYDAAYAALAEALNAPLLTADAALARAPGTRCEIELLTSSR